MLLNSPIKREARALQLDIDIDETSGSGQRLSNHRYSVAIDSLFQDGDLQLEGFYTRIRTYSDL